MTPAGRALSNVHGPRGDWIIVTAAAAGGTALASASPVMLADAAACPGVLDLVTIVAARTWGGAPMGTILLALNTTLLFVALLLLGRALIGATGSRFATFATGLAAATSPAISAPWTPTIAGAVAAGAAAWLVARRSYRAPTPAGGGAAGAIVVPFVLAAAIVPPLAPLLSVTAGWLAWRADRLKRLPARHARIAGGALAVLLAPAVVLLVMPGSAGLPATACMLPNDVLPESARLLGALSVVLGGALLPAALAMLGLWTVLGSAGERAPIVWLVLLASACALIGGGAAGSLAPASLAFWMLCAMGLADVRRALSDTAIRRAWAVALAIALVVLQTVEMRSREIPADRLPRGHDSLSRRSLLRLLEAVPEGAAIASEDAVTGWLVRALPGPVRAQVRLHETPVDEHAVSERLTTSRLFALPRGQWRLQQLGFRVSAVNGALPGLAEILPGAACSARLTATWRSLPELTSAEQLILVAGNALSRGPVYVFAWSDEPPDARALDWPAEALRGFHPRSFAMAEAEDVRNLREELLGYDADPATFIGSSAPPHVARVEMWRTPAAPLQLSVALGARPARVMARVADAAAAHDLILCPSFPYDIEPIVAEP